MNVTILGGGNIGMCLAGEISRVKGYDVTIFTSHADKFDKRIMIADDEKDIVYFSGNIVATSDLKFAILGADIILCTFPAFLRKKIIREIEEYIKPSACLGFFPGYGGAEFYCENIIKKGVTIFALQKVPYVARTKEVGKIAGLMSKKTKIFEAAIPHEKTKEIAQLLEDMLLIKCEILPNYMAATLLPGNPLLHTSGSSVYLKNYVNGYNYEKQIYYYQSWNDECSEVICKLSDELHEICEKIPLDLSAVKTIQEYYESPTPEKLTIKFHNIPSYRLLKLPMIKNEKGFVPDFSSRFFTEDIPFGLCIIKGIAIIANIETPNVDSILDWYYKMTKKEYFRKDGTFGKDIYETAIPQLFGIKSMEDLVEFYMR